VIYAIRAVSTEFIKFGRAANVGKRMETLSTGCPHELELVAVADWPDGQEKAVHLYLQDHCQRMEWFMDGIKAQEVIGWMRDRENGMRDLLRATRQLRKDWRDKPQKRVKPLIEDERKVWSATDKIRKQMANALLGGHA